MYPRPRATSRSFRVCRANRSRILSFNLKPDRTRDKARFNENRHFPISRNSLVVRVACTLGFFLRFTAFCHTTRWSRLLVSANITADNDDDERLRYVAPLAARNPLAAALPPCPCKIARRTKSREAAITWLMARYTSLRRWIMPDDFNDRAVAVSRRIPDRYLHTCMQPESPGVKGKERLIILKKLKSASRYRING